MKDFRFDHDKNAVSRDFSQERPNEISSKSIDTSQTRQKMLMQQ